MHALYLSPVGYDVGLTSVALARCARWSAVA